MNIRLINFRLNLLQRCLNAMRASFFLPTGLLMVITVSFSTIPALNGQDDIVTVDLPAQETVELVPEGKITFDAIEESSGLVKSRNRDDLYWTLNDSGDVARIFPVKRDGSIYLIPHWADDYEGILLVDAHNIDWEDIAADDAGNLIIGAFGNNGNGRKDLAVYILPEPAPESVVKSRVQTRIVFHYPDQKSFPPDKLNFDCEAVFHANGKLYFLSKHRSDTRTKLYRMDGMDERVSNPLTLLDTMEIGGMVTAADATADGARLAVLTYNGLWVFDKPADSDRYFRGRITWLPIAARQAEAVCWDDNDETLVITNEQRDVFYVSIKDLIRIR